MLFDLGQKGFGNIRQLHTDIYPSGSLYAYQPYFGLYFYNIKPNI